MGHCKAEALCPELLRATPCFEVRNYLLYKNERVKGDGEELGQLLVPRPYRKGLEDKIEVKRISPNEIDQSNQGIRKIFARVGLPKEILMDQGSNFIFKLKEGVQLSVFGDSGHPFTIHKLWPSEQFKRTLTGKLKNFIADEPQKWNQVLPPLLLPVQETPQASVGLSSFGLPYS